MKTLRSTNKSGIKMKVFIVALILSTITMSLQAQEYKVAKSTGRLEIHAGKVTVEGYSGNEIIFSTRDGKNNDDERAKGLTSINAAGLTDTGGLGVNVSVNGDVISVNQLRKTNSPD